MPPCKFIAIALIAFGLLSACSEAEKPGTTTSTEVSADPSADANVDPNVDRTDSHAFTPAQDAFVAAYLASSAGAEGMDLERVITEPSGLSHEEMSTIFAHPQLGMRGLEVMVDLMKPEGSMYFDAIFGANYGQHDIRHWLIPTMQENAFLEFRPTGPGLFIDDAEGGTSADEWVMVAKIEGKEIPLGNGISVRRFRDGWIVDAIDVYDTAPSRMPPPEDAAAMIGDMPPPPPLPPYPVMEFKAVEQDVPSLSEAARQWLTARQAVHAAGTEHANTTPSTLSNEELHHLHNHPSVAMDPQLVADMMHPTDSVYIDPLFGRFEGQAKIRDWYTDIMGKVGDIKFEALAPIAWDGNTSLQMWRQYAEPEGGDRVNMAWGFSLRKFKDGWITYAADYFDTAAMADPAVQAVSTAIGSRITPEDIMRYRTPNASSEG